MLDLSPYFWERFVTATRTNHSFSNILGHQVIDGIPFQVDGRACLFGKEQAKDAHQTRADYPDILGVPVFRTFDEIHLLHAAQWTDQEGETIAYVRLNYADGTRHDFPIGYGVHVRDWQRLQSEERELLTDPDSKVIWRGPGIRRFGSTQRMFKTRLVNPVPSVIVTTVDFVSAGQIASYDIAAATVVNHDPRRPMTPAVPLDGPERHFDGTVRIRVVDAAGRPLAGVWVCPDINVEGTAAATVTTPFYTSASGDGLVRYPKQRSVCFVFEVTKDGWRKETEGIEFMRLAQNGQLPGGPVVVIRMVPERTPAGLGELAVGTNQPAIGTTGSNPPSSSSLPPVVGETTGLAQASRAAGVASRRAAQRSHPFLIFDYPVGSTVRVEFADQLSDPKWQPLLTITNLPYSPYIFECGNEGPPQPQRFYRPVLLH